MQMGIFVCIDENISNGVIKYIYGLLFIFCGHLNSLLIEGLPEKLFDLWILGTTLIEFFATNIDNHANHNGSKDGQYGIKPY